MSPHDVMAEELRQCRERVTEIERELAIAQDRINRAIEGTEPEICHDNLAVHAAHAAIRAILQGKEQARGPDMPVSKAKEQRMWRVVDQLADSGEYSGWLAVEHELRNLGFIRARYLLDNDRIREDLDHRCAEARKRRQKE
jgi:hypothetical protein